MQKKTRTPLTGPVQDPRVDSRHKGPVTRTVFPWRDVILYHYFLLICENKTSIFHGLIKSFVVSNYLLAKSGAIILSCDYDTETNPAYKHKSLLETTISVI